MHSSGYLEPTRELRITLNFGSSSPLPNAGAPSPCHASYLCIPISVLSCSACFCLCSQQFKLGHISPSHIFPKPFLSSEIKLQPSQEFCRALSLSSLPMSQHDFSLGHLHAWFSLSESFLSLAHDLSPGLLKSQKRGPHLKHPLHLLPAVLSQ